MTEGGGEKCLKCGAAVVDGQVCPQCGVIYAKAKRPKVVNRVNEQPELTLVQRDKRALLFLAAFFFLLFVFVATQDKEEQTAPPPTITEKKIIIPPQPLPEMVKFTWTLSGFNTILMASFTLRNGSTSTWKDMVVVCNGFAKSGTRLSTNTGTVYDVITPGGVLKVLDLNLGFTNQQIDSASCSVIKAVEVP